MIKVATARTPHKIQQIRRRDRNAFKTVSGVNSRNSGQTAQSCVVAWTRAVTWRSAEESSRLVKRPLGRRRRATRGWNHKHVRDTEGRYVSEPIAVETLGVLSTSAHQLMSLLGRRTAQDSGEARETSFLFQRCSVLVQHFSVVLLHDSLPVIDCTDWWSYLLCIFFFF